MWDLSGPGIEPLSPALASRFFTTEPPGKPHDCFVREFCWGVFLQPSRATPPCYSGVPSRKLLQGLALALPWVLPGGQLGAQCVDAKPWQGQWAQGLRMPSVYFFKFIFNWSIDELSSSVQSLSWVQLFATPWITARQASLSITNSWSSLRLTSIKSVMPSSHLILCHPLLLLPPIPPSIRVFSNESTLRMRWPKYWSSASASFLPKKSHSWSPSEWTGWISLQSKRLSRVFCNTTVEKHQFFDAQPSSQSNSHIHTWPLEKP